MTEDPPPSPGGDGPSSRWALPKESYTPWFTRVLAFLIDWVPVWLIFLVPMIGLLITDGADCFDAVYGSSSDHCATSSSGLWLAVQLIGFLPAMAYFFWNVCYRQGKTGQSIGKSMMKFQVISEKTWQPIGFWLSLVRQIAHYVDQLICYIGYLFPLWDDKRQTIADKLVSSVCVPLDQLQQ